MKRSYSLDLIRLLLAYAIALFHFGYPIAPGPTVTVQIFFVISGYFLARKYYTRSHSDPEKSYSAWRYTLDHVRTFYPHYLLAMLLFLGYALLRSVLLFLGNPNIQGLWEILNLIYDQVPDILFLQSSYQYYANLNSPTWQISALVIAGYFVYALLCHNEKLSRTILFPGGVFMITCLLADCEDLFSRMGPFFLPLLRAFAPLCMGVLTYCFSVSEYCSRLKSKKFLFNLLTLLSLPVLILFQDRNQLHLVWSGLLILGCMEPGSIFERMLGHKCFAGCAKLSYIIYLNHGLLCRFYPNIIQPAFDKVGFSMSETGHCIAYLVILTAFCLLLSWAMNQILALRKSRHTEIV